MDRLGNKFDVCLSLFWLYNLTERAVPSVGAQLNIHFGKYILSKPVGTTVKLTFQPHIMNFHPQNEAFM